MSLLGGAVAEGFVPVCGGRAEGVERGRGPMREGVACHLRVGSGTERRYLHSCVGVWRCVSCGERGVVLAPGRRGRVFRRPWVLSGGRLLV